MTVISYLLYWTPSQIHSGLHAYPFGNHHVVLSNNEAERQKMSQSAGQSVRHLFEKTLVNEARTLLYGLF